MGLVKMPSKNLKKMAILGICVFFMIMIVIYICYKIRLVTEAKKSNKAETTMIDTEREKAWQYRMAEMAKFKENLRQACHSEQKIMVYKKIPANSGIFISNDDEKISQPSKKTQDYTMTDNTVPFPTEALVRQCEIDLKKQPNFPSKLAEKISTMCSNKYNALTRWVANIDYKSDRLFVATKASYFETFLGDNVFVRFDNKTTARIATVTAPYELIATDISTPEDRNKGIRRGLMQLKERKTNKVLSEYVSFDMLPFEYSDFSIARDSWHNCFDLDKSDMSNDKKAEAWMYYDINDNYRYFFEQAVE